MPIADFWFDPSCPYSWTASRWLLEAAEVRELELHWHVMSLSILNEHLDEDPEGDTEGYLWGPARLCAAIAELHGEQALSRFHTAYGEQALVRGEWPGFEAPLAAAGLPTDLADTAWTTAYEEPLRASHAQAVALVGNRVGTPVLAITEEDGERHALFGPVVAPVPRGEAAGRLWDGVRALATTPNFYEFRRPAPGDPPL
ncbi:DsbA family protein [Streptomyces sp. XM4193]|uniref:DsbA family protein n=1 Tax=Streptomyces sp. XM4193 TaxID=2929782 RepID=UPI001FF74FBB|nr:DsbA family protein [Streptomyces sp. XM4193]MCK1797253.1 DsbA family protein [Streptomyces sp. XM4193]